MIVFLLLTIDYIDIDTKYVNRNIIEIDRKNLKKINEKTFRDRGSGFVEILSYKLWDNWTQTGT